jgi:hypothetical protein
VNHFLARAVQDWIFYFHQAKAEMGISSSWEPLVQIARSGGAVVASSGNRNEERRLAASRRHARIEAALLDIEPESLKLIRLTCEEPLRLWREPYGQLGNVAHLTDAVYRARGASGSTREIGPWLDRLAIKHAQGKANGSTLDDIRRGCEELMNQPRNEYVQALGRIG